MRVWFITGTSTGFGRVWTRAALERGDQVAATARHISTLDDLVSEFGERVLPLTLDVRDRDAAFAAVAAAHEHFGRLDIVVNSAGYAHHGFVEELSEEDVRTQIETNFYGMLWVTQAALPFMREQGSGRILQVSSFGGVTAGPMLGLYNASKWALEALSQALSMEVAQFGIKVTMLEPGPFATDAIGRSAKYSADLAAYDVSRGAAKESFFKYWSGRPAPAESTIQAVFTVVDSDDPPLRIFLGARGIEIARRQFASRLETWERWREVSESCRAD